MELTKQELNLLLQMFQQVNFPSAEAKLLAGQLQLKIEGQLSEQVPSPPQSKQE